MIQTVAARSAGIVLYNHQILLMYRIKNGHTYYTIPGGTVEKGESKLDAAIREIAEETSVMVTGHELRYLLTITSPETIKQEYFYLCSYVSGMVHLPASSQEAARMNAQNYYQPLWISIDQLTQINLYPLEIKELLITDIAHHFPTRDTLHLMIDSKNIRQS